MGDSMTSLPVSPRVVESLSVAAGLACIFVDLTFTYGAGTLYMPGLATCNPSWIKSSREISLGFVAVRLTSHKTGLPDDVIARFNPLLDRTDPLRPVIRFIPIDKNPSPVAVANFGVLIQAIYDARHAEWDILRYED